MKTIKTISRLVSKAGLRTRALVVVATLAITGCEAPLNLEQVKAEQEKPIHRYDALQAAAHSEEQVAVVSSVGAVLLSGDNGKTWQRFDLPGSPSLIDVTACPSGEFFALDSSRQIWSLAGDRGEWTPITIDTPENTLSIHCAPDGRVWVSASYGTLFWLDADRSQVNEFSIEEDMQFTEVRFVDPLKGFAVGEFGTVMATTDGGENWETRESIPNDFYPMAADFLDENTGWVGGLDGVIWRTDDGGRSWQRQNTLTSSPIYNIQANGRGVFAVGGSAKMVELSDDQWRVFEGAPHVLTYMRGLDLLDDGSLLVAGGGGTLAVIPLSDRKS